MLKRTEGIVLKTTVFGEADLIVVFLTKEFGIMRGFAKSPRKIKSRFGSSLEPLTYSRLSFMGKEGSNLPRITQSDIIKPFNSIREDYRSFLKAAEIIDLALRFLPEREPHPELFKLMLDTLAGLGRERDSRLGYLYYKIKFLQIAGLAPRLDMCGRCGCGLSAIRSVCNGMKHIFYVSHGTVICSDCGRDSGQAVHISEGALRFYASLLKWPVMSLDRIKAPDIFIRDLGFAIDSHIRHVLGSGPVSAETVIHKIISAEA
ncbi:MAG: DNA repair protein RecO [Dissulfurispiraceae bacterium]|jgi:DNA repair protein RecO (recombination protein O)|nr:DNA repair protein RecO [Dissulfurispiraceae bacterium]